MKKSSLIAGAWVILFSAQYLDLKSQHIQWQSFDKDIFLKAQEAGKPVLLHLSANWCHWCHVMEEVTYQNKDVIRYIDEHYIAATEDHDRRPDLANRYRDYGWPAIIIYSANGKEIFKQAGYIAPVRFLEILKNLKSDLTEETANGHSMPAVPTSVVQSAENLEFIKRDVYQNIDVKTGGFAMGQKYLDFEMFEYAFNHRQDDILRNFLEVSVRNSLKLSDTVWGGVFQYSTHGDWDHPHYEKLLSIQARYIKMYLWYFFISEDSAFLNAALETYKYVNRFLRKRDGSFANAQDADLIKGQKAHRYYNLPEKKRMKAGIPAIDSNAYTDNNARMIEALVYLYAYTGTATYLQHAEEAANFLISKNKRSDGLYNHGITSDFTPSLTDQIQVAKSMMLLHRATSDTVYLREGIEVLDHVVRNFFDGTCMRSFLPADHYLLPGCVISENIESARLLNLYGKILGNNQWTMVAGEIRNYLLSDHVYEVISIEPGILSLHEEVESEPFKAVYTSGCGMRSDDELVLATLRIPKYYIYSQWVKDSTFISEVATLESNEILYGQSSVVFFCTSTYCSSPLSSVDEFETFVRRRVLISGDL